MCSRRYVHQVDVGHLYAAIEPQFDIHVSGEVLVMLGSGVVEGVPEDRMAFAVYYVGVVIRRVQ